MNGKLWANDPDCLLVRDTRTELSLAEIQTTATAIALTGGMALASDRMSELPRERRDILALLIPPLPNPVVHTALFNSGIPRFVHTTVARPWGNWELIGVFNDSAGEQIFTLDWAELRLANEPYHVSELWTSCYFGIHARQFSLSVPPHGARLLCLRPSDGAPAVVSTSFHAGQGAIDVVDWSFDSRKHVITWESSIGRRSSGTITLWLPDRFRPARLTSTADHATWQRLATDEIVVTARVNRNARFTLELENHPL